MSPLSPGISGPAPIPERIWQSVRIKDFSSPQDGLRRRMDKLKSSIEEANNAVDKEREKNVSLLHLIFPPDIAKRLWLGECREYQTPLRKWTHLICHFGPRRINRSEDPQQRDHALQRHRRFHFDMFDNHAVHGDQDAGGPLQPVRRLLWTVGRVQGNRPEKRESG